ncbi:MAG: hypothetical protein IJS01_07600 [Lentisphaeria bacterium]|nr:hypothetical protein [Lentisphaeria bacterium]
MITIEPPGGNFEAESAKRRLEELKEEYAKLLAEYDELTGPVRCNLESEYMMRIGRLEYRLFSLQVRAQQLKREIALYQAAENRRETISPDEVAGIIEREFAAYRAALAEQREKLRKAEEQYFAPKLSVDDTRALRTLYHDMVRKLHPDINRDLPEEAKRLWVRIVEAYKTGDWQELNILADMVYDLLEDGRPAAGSPEGMARLFEEERRIAGKIAAIRERIDRLRKQPPYSWLTLLEDNEAVNARRRELREQRTRFEEYIAELTVLRDKLCGGENG